METIQNPLNNKTLLLIDGTVHMINILKRAKELGIHTVVANFYEPEKAKAKLYADAYEVVNIADIDAMAEVIHKYHVDGILQGCTDSHLLYYQALCEKFGFPCYGTLEQFQLCTNKELMKQKCKQYGVPVTKEYTIDGLTDEEINSIVVFPVITKPVDGSGSRGFSICNNTAELKNAYTQAQKYSLSGKVLIEKYMNYKRSVIVHYTIVGGSIIYSGMSDKESKKVSEAGAPIMSLQYFPSIVEEEYLKTVNNNVIKMLDGIGLKNGVVWIEAFYDNTGFTFNEMGYRFGGSLTYYPVEYYTGIKQLDLQMEFALTGKNEPCEIRKQHQDKVYCIFPMHVKPGVIAQIKGLKELTSRDECIVFVPTHLKGDVIQDWGSTQQVFGYIHFVVNSRDEAEHFIDWIISTLSVIDDKGEELLYNLHRERIN